MCRCGRCLEFAKAREQICLGEENLELPLLMFSAEKNQYKANEDQPGKSTSMNRPSPHEARSLRSFQDNSPESLPFCPWKSKECSGYLGV